MKHQSTRKALQPEIIRTILQDVNINTEVLLEMYGRTCSLQA